MLYPLNIRGFARGQSDTGVFIAKIFNLYSADIIETCFLRLPEKSFSKERTRHRNTFLKTAAGGLRCGHYWGLAPQNKTQVVL
jgi:hypothetical protein